MSIQITPQANPSKLIPDILNHIMSYLDDIDIKLAKNEVVDFDQLLAYNSKCGYLSILKTMQINNHRSYIIISHNAWKYKHADVFTWIIVNKYS